MSTQKKTILVVDDSKEMSKVMADMLTFKEYDVAVVNHGKDAIETALNTHPDLILLDLLMPEIDGYEVIRQIQKDSWGKTAKILMLTAVEGMGEIPFDIKLSPNDYLIKSIWGVEEVAAKIERKLAE